MKTLSIITLSLILTFQFQAFSNNDLRDPQNLLPLIDAFVGEQSFESAFRCGDSAIHLYRNNVIECSVGGCAHKQLSEPVQMQWTVTQCGSRSMKLSMGPLSVDYTAEEFINVDHGNFVRSSLKDALHTVSPQEVEKFVEIESVNPTKFKFGNGAEIESLLIHAGIHVMVEGQSQKAPVTVEIGRGISPLGSVLSVQVLGVEIKAIAGSSR